MISLSNFKFMFPEKLIRKFLNKIENITTLKNNFFKISVYTTQYGR